MCVCGISYSACSAHAPYCHLWPVWLYNIFPHYQINGTIFGKKSWNKNDVFCFSLQTLSEIFLILRRTERDVITQVCRSSCEVSVLNETWIFSTDFGKQPHISNFINILSVVAELFRAGGWRGGQTDMTKLIVAFRNFAKALKTIKYIPLICDRSVTTQNLAFLSYCYRKKRLQMHF